MWKWWRWIVVLPVGLSLVACTSTVDPAPRITSAAALAAEQGAPTAQWQPDAAARAAARDRVTELLAEPLTPQRAAQVAVLYHPNLQAVFAELGIAQADLAQAMTIGNPSLGFVRRSGGGEHETEAGLLVPLMDLLLRPLARKVAEAELERVRFVAGRAILDTAAEASAATYEYAAAEELVARLEDIEELDRLAAEFLEELAKAGNIGPLERAHGQAAWTESQLALGASRFVAGQARERLQRALGLAESGAVPWQVHAELPPLPEEELPARDFEAQALTQRLDLAAARWAVQTLEHALTAKRKTRLWPIHAEVGIETEKGDGVRLTGPVLELELPLFDTGKASLARLEAELARARWQLEALTGEARSEVREHLAALTASRARAQLVIRRLLPQRREILDLTLRHYNMMLLGTPDVIVAKQQELSAEKERLEALRDYWVARVELARAIGGVLPDEPAPPVPPAPKGMEHHDHSHSSHSGGTP